LAGAGAFTFWYARGYSYLSNDPEACVNCHIMKDNYAAWRVSSHRTVACNDCHVPHSFVRKWYAKAENGFRHSWAFTFENVQRLRITPADLRRLQKNCVRCHAPFVDQVLMTAPASEMNCTTCHRATGHAE
jgi:cytochrome c nitrite reductase small subunit